MPDYTVSPGAVAPITWPLGDTGIAAQLTYKVKNQVDESVFYPASNTGIAERDAGVYSIHAFTFPTLAGSYLGELYDGAELVWTDSIQIVGSALSPLLGGGRSSMADLITRVRLLINDPSSGSQQFSDAQLQQWLDENREDVRYLELTPEWQTSGTATQWFSFYDGVYGGHWESDAAFVSRAWSPVTPDTSDFLTGKWTWNASQFPPIFISGRTYDVYSAAADALEAWASAVALDFDVSTGRNNLSLSRSQKRAGLLQVAGQYRTRGRTTSIPLTRSDT